MVVVVKLIDGYFVEVVLDVNFKFVKFWVLVVLVFEYVRFLDDGFYCVIDIYLKVGLNNIDLFF